VKYLQFLWDSKECYSLPLQPIKERKILNFKNGWSKIKFTKEMKAG
jgi:hypothetical protein